MPDDGGDGTNAERREQRQHVLHQVERPERPEIAVVGLVPAGGAPVATLIRREHVVPGPGERRHHLAPAIGKLREAVQQQKRRPSPLACLQQVHAQTVHVLHEARVHPLRQNGGVERPDGGHVRLHAVWRDDARDAA